MKSWALVALAGFAAALVLRALAAPARAQAVGVGGYIAEEPSSPTRETSPRSEEPPGWIPPIPRGVLASVHALMDEAFSLARERSKGMLLYSIHRLGAQDWSFHFGDRLARRRVQVTFSAGRLAEIETWIGEAEEPDPPPAAEPVQDELRSDDDGDRKSGILAPIAPSRAAQTAARTASRIRARVVSYTQRTREVDGSWRTQESSEPAEEGFWDACGPIGEMFLDTPEVERRLLRMGIGAREIESIALHHPMTRSCRKPYRAPLLGKDIPLVALRRPVWAIATASSILYLHAATGKLLYRRRRDSR